MSSDQPKKPETQGAMAVGVASVLLMLGGLYVILTNDVAVGAALIVIGAAITPSVAWWRRQPRDDECSQR